MASVPPSVRWLPGPGAAVVAVPGLGLSVDVPARTLALLGPAVGAVALPGYGEPADRGVLLSPAALAERLLSRLADLATPPAVLFGHSASCQIVVHAAVAAPERVTGLVLAGPTTDPRAPGWCGLAQRWVRTAVWERPGQLPLLIRDYTRVGLPTMARAMELARRDRIDRVLRGVTCPVLVVRGRHDRIAPADWIGALAALAPDGEARTLPAGGHMVPVTHPRLLAPHLQGLLA